MCSAARWSPRPADSTPLGEDGDSEFGDLIEDSEAIQPSAPGCNQRSSSARLVDAQNAQIWTASVVIGIEPKSAQNGSSLAAYGHQ